MRAVSPTRVALLLGFALFWCQKADAPAVVVQDGAWRDSAGIRVVEHEVPPTNAVFRLVSDVPSLDLGGLTETGATEFDGSTPWLSAIVQSDGTIVVNDGTQIRFLGADGEHIRTVGRRGAGPGEFLQLQELCLLPDDSLLAVDFPSGRVTRLAPDGSTIQSRTLPGRMRRNGCGAGDLLVVQTGNSRQESRKDATLLVEHRLFDSTGEPRSSFLLLPASFSAGPISFEPSFGFARDELMVADPRRYEIQLRDRHGVLKRLIRVREPPKPVSNSEWDALLSSMLPKGTPREDGDRFLKLVQRLRPESFPLFRRAWATSSGQIWVQGFHDESSFIVFQADGRLLGRVRAPSGSVVAVLPERLVLRVPDVDGAVHLKFYSLRSP